jgi:N-acetylglucosamine-6-sulfatase
LIYPGPVSTSGANPRSRGLPTGLFSRKTVLMAHRPATCTTSSCHDREGTLMKWSWLASVVVLAGLQGMPTLRAETPVRPNVLVILTDDQRFDAMSCAGHPFLKTPHMDRLAREGVRFRNAFVTCSLCSPSRASLLSGKYPHSHGVLNNFTDYPRDLPSYPRRLKDNGWETAYIGKWHMGEHCDEPRPGFDYWMSHKGQGSYFDTTFNINGTRRLIKGYYTTVVTDYAVDWLTQKRSKPFCLVLGHKAPHGGPIEPEPKYRNAFNDVVIRLPANADAYKDGKPAWLEQSVPTWHGLKGPLYGQKEYGRFVRSYIGTIASVEDSLGRILAALERTGQLDSTLIVYTTDNGFALGEHGRVDKRTMYEESIRVPLLVRYPPLVPKGKEVTRMVLNIDLAPSILDLCGVAKLEGIHGRSWKPLLAGDDRGWRRSWHYTYNYEKEFPYTPNVRGVRTDEWKYIHYPHGDDRPDRYKAELYNLADDPLETKNLIDDLRYSDRVKELKAELGRRLEETGALPDRMPLDEGIKNVPPKY